MNAKERKLRDLDFERRLQPRMIWPSQQNGTLWLHRQPTLKNSRALKLTEVEDNAIGRALRRRQHRLERGWLPYAKR